MGPLLAILALVLSWLPVVVDCRGGAESVREYEVTTFEARITGTIAQPDGSLAPVYAKAVQRRLVPHDGGGSCFGRAYPCVVLPDQAPPALGEVTYLSDPVAIDWSDNRSDPPCN